MKRIFYQLEWAICGNKKFVGHINGNIFNCYIGETTDCVIIADDNITCWKDITNTKTGKEIINIIKKQEIKNV